MSAWLPPGLWLLVRLRIGSALREGGRRLRTPGGLVTALLMVAFLSAWLVPLLTLPQGFRPVSPAWLQAVGPVGLAMVWFGQVALRGGGEVLGFMPSEADQLFAAPFSPSQLLRYKVTLLLFAWVFGGLILSPMAMFYATRPLGGVFAALLVLPFLQLSAMVAAMARQGGRRRTWYRGVFLLFLVVGGAGAMWLPRVSGAGALERLTSLQAQPVFAALLMPFTLGARLLYATDTTELVTAALGMLVVDIALVGVLLRLGRGSWLEIAADGAQHMASTLQRYRSGGGVSALGGWWGTRVPLLPRWGGVGPVLWRRAVEVLRRPAVFAALGGVVLMVAGIGLAVPMLVPGVARPSLARGMLLASVVWGTVLVPGVLRLDFRADLDRMDTLLSLPIRPSAIFLGQVLPMAALVSGLAWLIDVVVVVWTPAVARDVLVIFLAQPAFALSVVCVENALFLWLPVRTEAGEAALQSVGRNLMVSFLGWGLHGLGGVAAVVVAVSVYWAAGSIVLAGVAAALPLLAMAALAVVAGSYRLARFDPSIHVPR